MNFFSNSYFCVAFDFNEHALLLLSLFAIIAVCYYRSPRAQLNDNNTTHVTCAEENNALAHRVQILVAFIMIWLSDWQWERLRVNGWIEGCCGLRKESTQKLMLRRHSSQCTHSSHTVAKLEQIVVSIYCRQSTDLTFHCCQYDLHHHHHIQQTDPGNSFIGHQLIRLCESWTYCFWFD